MIQTSATSFTVLDGRHTHLILKNCSHSTRVGGGRAGTRRTTILKTEKIQIIHILYTRRTRCRHVICTPQRAETITRDFEKCPFVWRTGEERECHAKRHRNETTSYKGRIQRFYAVSSDFRRTAPSFHRSDASNTLVSSSSSPRSNKCVSERIRAESLDPGDGICGG